MWWSERKEENGRGTFMMVKEKEITHWNKGKERKIERAEKNSDMQGNVG